MNKPRFQISIPSLGERGGASVEYLVGVMVVAFAVWATMSGFGEAAIKGIKLAGSDLLGLN